MGRGSCTPVTLPTVPGRMQVPAPALLSPAADVDRPLASLLISLAEGLPPAEVRILNLLGRAYLDHGGALLPISAESLEHMCGECASGGCAHEPVRRAAIEVLAPLVSGVWSSHFDVVEDFGSVFGVDVIAVGQRPRAVLEATAVLLGDASAVVVTSSDLGVRRAEVAPGVRCATCRTSLECAHLMLARPLRGPSLFEVIAAELRAAGPERVRLTAGAREGTHPRVPEVSVEWQDPHWLRVVLTRRSARYILAAYVIQTGTPSMSPLVEVATLLRAV